MKTDWYKIWLILLLTLAGWQPLNAETLRPVRIDGNFSRKSLARFYAKRHTPKRLTAAAAYALFDTPQKDKFCINCFYWLLFSVENQSNAAQDLVIDFNNAHVDTIELFQIDKDSQQPVSIGFGGDRMPFFERKGINRRFIFPVTLRAGEKQQYLLKIDQRYSTMSYPLILWSKSNFIRAENRDTLILSLYFGGLVMIALFSFITGFIVRQSLFHYYAFYMMAMSLFQFANLGLLFKHIHPNNYALKNIIHVALIPLMLFAFIEFSIQFLQIKGKSKALDKMTLVFYVLIAVFFAGLLAFYKPTNLFMFSFFVHLLIAMTLTLLATYSVYAFRHGEQKRAIILVLADAILIIGGIIMTLDNAGIISHSYLQSKAMILGSMIEVIIFVIAIILSVKEVYKKENEWILAQAQHDKEIYKSFVRGLNEESNKISKELHDDIGSRLALLENIIREDTDKAQLLSYVKNISTSVRKVSSELSPIDAAFTGLKQRIKEWIHEIGAHNKMEINFYYNVASPIDNSTALEIYRIIQEATQNCIKHAQASQVFIQIIGHDDEISLTIDDDGVGFDPSKHTSHGNGIRNMSFRATSVGGNFEISAAPNKGTHIMVSIPVKTTQQ